MCLSARERAEQAVQEIRQDATNVLGHVDWPEAVRIIQLAILEAVEAVDIEDDDEEGYQPGRYLGS